jgi:hypothetical protein
VPELQTRESNRATWTFPDGAEFEYDGMWISPRETL